MAITYEPYPTANSRKRREVTVKINGVITGYICRSVVYGYHYAVKKAPYSSKEHVGKTFDTIAEVKASIEGTDND